MYKIPNRVRCQGAACVRSTFVKCSPNLGNLAQGKCSGCNGPIGAVFYSGAQGNFIIQANGQDGCINQYSGRHASWCMQAKCASSTQIDTSGTRNNMILDVDHSIHFHKFKRSSFHNLASLAWQASNSLQRTFECALPANVSKHGAFILTSRLA